MLRRTECPHRKADFILESGQKPLSHAHVHDLPRGLKENNQLGRTPRTSFVAAPPDRCFPLAWYSKDKPTKLKGLLDQCAPVPTYQGLMSGDKLTDTESQCDATPRDHYAQKMLQPTRDCASIPKRRRAIVPMGLCTKALLRILAAAHRCSRCVTERLCPSSPIRICAFALLLQSASGPKCLS